MEGASEFLRSAVPFSGSSLWVCEKLVLGGLSSERFRRSSWTENGAGAARGQVLSSISLSSGKPRGMPHPSPDAAEQRGGGAGLLGATSSLRGKGHLLPAREGPSHPPAPSGMACLPTCSLGMVFPPTCSPRNDLCTHLFPGNGLLTSMFPWEWPSHMLGK